MDISSLVAAQLLKSNQFACDLHDVDLAVRKAAERRAMWRVRLAAIASRLGPERRTPRTVASLATVSPAQ